MEKTILNNSLKLQQFDSLNKLSYISFYEFLKNYTYLKSRSFIKKNFANKSASEVFYTLLLTRLVNNQFLIYDIIPRSYSNIINSY